MGNAAHGLILACCILRSHSSFDRQESRWFIFVYGHERLPDLVYIVLEPDDSFGYLRPLIIFLAGCRAAHVDVGADDHENIAAVLTGIVVVELVHVVRFHDGGGNFELLLQQALWTPKMPLSQL